MLSLNRRVDVVLILLDLSAAFDTIDHDILIERLRHRFGFEGPVLDWVRSFMDGRTQRISIGGSMVSNAHVLKFGVPQGAVLGPSLFSLYVSPIEDIIIRHGLQTVIFADDTQLYITCDSPTSSLTTSIEACVDEIRHWMRANLLALNDSKTEVIWFSSKNMKSEVRGMTPDIRIGETFVRPSDKVRDLGVTLDSGATLSSQVASVCSAASHALWKIGKIRKFLGQHSAEKLIHAFVTSRIDYCNSLLFGLPDYEINKLQLIQNSAARLVARIRKRDRCHITPVLQALHWLPVDQRIRFKILCIIFKIIHCNTAPRYLTELITIRMPIRENMRSNSSVSLVQSKIKTNKSYGDRAFSVCAPKLWNKLPEAIRSINTFNNFKSQVKTYLFKIAF